jgi:predicted ArsR family transcriptional regulator
VTAPWDTVAALADPVRRALYEHVRRQDRAVTREDAASALAISRSLTAFHLDKLVEAGLLRARYEAPTDRPRGRGRAPKVYEATEAGLTLNLPPRHYELMGEILAGAVAGAPTDARAEAQRRAEALGRLLGGRFIESGNSVETALAELGFEPRSGPSGDAVLDNCPFHALASRHPDLICGLNRAFVAGLLSGLGAESLTAELRPRPGHCCVRVSLSA